MAGFGIGALCLRVGNWNIAKDCGYAPGSEGRWRDG